MTSDERPFQLRSVAVSVFLPTLLFSIGEGAIIPIIPAVAGNLGATLAVAGVISSLIMLGELVGDVPSGWIVSRIGERFAMMWAALLAVVGVATAAISPNPFVLAVGIFCIGLATAVFGLARHAFMTTYVPMRYRARALSSLGGVFRAGTFIGPFLAAGVIHLTGTSQAAFWVMVICCAGSAITLLVLPDPAEMFGRPPSTRTADGEERTGGEELASEESSGLIASIRAHGAVLTRMGTTAALVGALRSCRAVLLPLWAVSIGVSETDTALIIGVVGAVEFALFYASGQVMDRWGRIWTAVPSMIGLGSGFIVLAFTHDLDEARVWFIAVALVLALSNGLGSGILMTLGSDLAPPDRPAPFLGAYRFLGDAGTAAAPLAMSGITAAASISLAAGTIGGVGLIGAFLLFRFIPRFIDRGTRPFP
ncbi:MFS transporter [Plantibacter sp. PA-3-X8]|uniref:MFS transporter n=1 Tax=Plantibacter sp. PA-3-X8 TaxID=2480625 RepID=UPI000F5F8638|nr:MFS transporter [Plantibacter sp. PA-3-X8]AZH83451.1 MFS transporter [Plantibacter sp. PA-3-X8]